MQTTKNDTWVPAHHRSGIIEEATFGLSAPKARTDPDAVIVILWGERFR